MLFIDMGGGKTNVILMLLKYRKQCGDKVKAIVFVPFITSVSTWIDETAKHAPGLKCVPLLGNTAENKLKLSEEGDLFVICYQSAVAMMSHKVPGKDGKIEWHILPDEVRKYFKNFNFMICDEVHRCFVAGTLIETPAGAKSIEALQIGDLVETGFGSKKISNIFKSETRQVFTLMLADGSTIECTPNHPFLTDDGWVEAANLKGKHVFKNQEMSNLRQTVCKKGNLKILLDEVQSYWAAWSAQTPMSHSMGRSYLHTMRETFFGPRKASQKTLQQILFSQMAHGAARVHRKNNNQGMESKSKCFSQTIGKNRVREETCPSQQFENEKEQPNVHTWDAYENFTNSQRKRKWIWGKPWWQWKTYHTTKNALGSAWCWLENRIGNKNTQKDSLPNCLQSRYWKSGIKNSHRSRWSWAQWGNSKEERLKEKYAAGRVRVVNISFQERNNTTPVFNLEVEGCPHYFANGILVHNCKSSTSLTFRLCRTISEQCQWVVGLTGTPFGRNLEDLWPQFYLIDFGKTLGHTLSFYKQVFFTRKKGWFNKFEFKFKKKLFPALKKMVKNRSIRYEISELQDMPPKQYVIKTLPTPDTSRGYCEDAVKKLREALKHSNYQEIKSNYLKLRQLSSGFMTLKGEDNERLQMSFDENPKLDTLQELIEAIPLDCKAIVFHHFVYSNHLISKRLTEMKVKHARIWGGQKKPIEELKKFQDDAACRVLVINSKSGSSSLNLQHAQYLIFFEPPDSPIDRSQAERRVWRPGQKNRVVIYDLLVKDTVDIKLHNANKEGADLLKELLDGKTNI